MITKETFMDGLANTLDRIEEESQTEFDEQEVIDILVEEKLLPYIDHEEYLRNRRSTIYYDQSLARQAKAELEKT